MAFVVVCFDEENTEFQEAKGLSSVFDQNIKKTKLKQDKKNRNW